MKLQDSWELLTKLAEINHSAVHTDSEYPVKRCLVLIKHNEDIFDFRHAECLLETTFISHEAVNSNKPLHELVATVCDKFENQLSLRGFLRLELLRQFLYGDN